MDARIHAGFSLPVSRVCSQDVPIRESPPLLEVFSSLGLGISKGLMKRAIVNTCFCLKPPVIRLKIEIFCSWAQAGTNCWETETIHCLLLYIQAKFLQCCVHYSCSQCRCPEQTITWPLAKILPYSNFKLLSCRQLLTVCCFCNSAGLCGTWNRDLGKNSPLGWFL